MANANVVYSLHKTSTREVCIYVNVFMYVQYVYICIHFCIFYKVYKHMFVREYFADK